MPQDFLDHLTLVNHGDDAHGLLAPRAEQRVGVPHSQDEVAPLLGGELGGRRRSEPNDECRIWKAPDALAAPLWRACFDTRTSHFALERCCVMAARKAVGAKTSKLRLILTLSRER